MHRADFRQKFGAVYEHSAWIADNVFDRGGNGFLSDPDAMIVCFESEFMATGADVQLAVLRAHPELACARAEHGLLSNASRNEQSGAGLDQCTEDEFAEFSKLNAAYRNKFGFPFIIAVKGRARAEILDIMGQRLNNDPETEFNTALEQVCRIARFRVEEIIDG